VLIRCEKCATLYELDDNMLPPGGAPVQCSRCQFVFTAYPEQRAGGPTTPAVAHEEGAGREPPDAAPEAAPAGEVAAAGSAQELGGEHVGCEGAEAGEGGDRADDRGPGALAGEAEERALGAALASAGEAGVDGAAAEAVAGAGATKQRGAAPRAGAGESQPRQVSDGAAADEEPKFTSDGRPIRKVPFPGDGAASSPRTATARPSLQAAPRGGERARLPWLVPVVVALILAFAAAVAWRLITMRSEHTGRQPGEGHSSLLRGDRPRGEPGAAPTPARHSALAARVGNVHSRSCPSAGG
jgi:predicted Zn finger-like uncharacterized protein